MCIKKFIYKYIYICVCVNDPMFLYMCYPIKSLGPSRNQLRYNFAAIKLSVKVAVFITFAQLIDC